MGIEQLLKTYREEILRIAAKHGAYNVRVFGSVARGEAGLDSDVDFLVELEAQRSLLDHIGLIQALVLDDDLYTFPRGTQFYGDGAASGSFSVAYTYINNF